MSSQQLGSGWGRFAEAIEFEILSQIGACSMSSVANDRITQGSRRGDGEAVSVRSRLTEVSGGSFGDEHIDHGPCGDREGRPIISRFSGPGGRTPPVRCELERSAAARRARRRGIR